MPIPNPQEFEENFFRQANAKSNDHRGKRTMMTTAAITKTTDIDERSHVGSGGGNDDENDGNGNSQSNDN